MIAVVVIVTTGAAQTVRLVGSPLNLLDAAHGKYLVAKLVVLAAMLALAASNRRRLGAPTSRPGGMSDTTAALMRRSVVAETALGLVVIAITASMVVASPAAPRDDVSVVSGVAPTTDR
jgi:putative copper export protein